MNWRDGILLWVLCKLGVHASLASRYARSLEQSSEHSLTASLTCPVSRTKGSLSSTEAVGLAQSQSAEAMHRSRRLPRLAGYDANVAVARVRGPTIADTTAIQ
ncbi:hypothetical protein BJX68DRAFT_260103 [Aspergillus pseudodeflectus]|uniref:Secreted protein n=1 Tax=Aspergillus pseudodeflectus TaxID=176178 RepID=A0ABR4J7Z6_9EURO